MKFTLKYRVFSPNLRNALHLFSFFSILGNEMENLLDQKRPPYSPKTPYGEAVGHALITSMAKVRDLKLERCSTRRDKSTDGPPPPPPERKIKKKKKTTGVEGKTTMSKVKGKRKREVNNGDILNLPDLLFTDQRDYLIKYNDNQLVKR
ncbi:hypothetical protein OROGR_029743 [Orobanche gracilis]